MILAKPVIANRYWILKKDDQKVGIVEAVDDGYDIKLENKKLNYKTIPMISRRENILFENPIKSAEIPKNIVHGFEVAGCVHNPLWDVKHRLPSVYTRHQKQIVVRCRVVHGQTAPCLASCTKSQTYYLATLCVSRSIPHSRRSK
jgi:hypothetical protein